jgi:hypothetical protein
MGRAWQPLLIGGMIQFRNEEDTMTKKQVDVIWMMIGMRDQFSEDAAKGMAKVWREAITQHPHSTFCLTIDGYDDDPKEIWEFEDARLYVQQWTRFAGVDDPETAQRYCTLETLGFLAACGVFGEPTKH